jgi:hypothetical protein
MPDNLVGCVKVGVASASHCRSFEDGDFLAMAAIIPSCFQLPSSLANVYQAKICEESYTVLVDSSVWN